ncbi:MAG: hypothetical protein M1813_004703 [Trichoglossum hirsutum]|nr:MAG: hypothetical protein M1813_004703 [Trichoglossum hirsutum]
MTSDYLKDLPASQQWLDANQPYFQHMTDILRLLDPQMYVRYNSINKFLPEDLKPACGAWATCAILRGMVDEGTPHRDASDYYCGLNCDTAWGDFTTAKIVFWELGISVEVKKGEAIFFLSRILTHNAVDTQGGVRNVVDAFMHQSLLIWKDRGQEKVTGYLRGGPRVKRRKLEEGERIATSTAREDEEDEEDDTEWEMDALYSARVVEQVEGEEESD